MCVTTNKAGHQHGAIAVGDFITGLQGEIAANRNNATFRLTQIPSLH
jgi:hypothetical protein